jgi:hypothetical protein
VNDIQQQQQQQQQLYSRRFETCQQRFVDQSSACQLLLDRAVRTARQQGMYSLVL